MERRISRYEDIHLAFAAKDAPYKQDVARAMGLSPAVFSHVIADRGGRPSQAWIERFCAAWDAAAREKDAASRG